VYCICTKINIGILNGHYILNFLYFSSHVVFYFYLNIVLPVNIEIRPHTSRLTQNQFRQKLNKVYNLRLEILADFAIINMLFYTYCLSYPRGDCLALITFYIVYVIDMILKKVKMSDHVIQTLALEPRYY
jgi:hypothetical protein